MFKKLPDPPQTTFSSGGPYVARSEYDRVCGELEALKTSFTDTCPKHLLPTEIKCKGWITIDRDHIAKLHLVRPYAAQEGWYSTYYCLIGSVDKCVDWKNCIWEVDI